jgi:hypothetical protein
LRVLVARLAVGLVGGFRGHRLAQQPGQRGAETRQQPPPVRGPAHALHQAIKRLGLHLSTSTLASNDHGPGRATI